MLKPIVLLLAVTGLVLGAAHAEAAKGKNPRKKGPEARLAKVDTDKDGKVSREEFAAKLGEGGEQATAKKFSKLDRNGDGYLTLDELKAAAEARQKKKSKKPKKTA
jgi:Ca2+-binding EF-hand superfamily protein